MERFKTNAHHLWWERRQWNHFNQASKLRNHPLSIQQMIIPIHAELHREVDPISPPEAFMARLALNHLNGLPVRYTSLDAAKSLSDELYDIAPEYSDHLYRQIPFIELSLDAMKRRAA